MKIYNTIEVSSKTHARLQKVGHLSCMAIIVISFILFFSNNTKVNMFLFYGSIVTYIIVNYQIIRGIVFSKPNE